MAPAAITTCAMRPGFPRGLRVLLVDGDDTARGRAEQQLANCGYEVGA